jgi:hypothetical protein
MTVIGDDVLLIISKNWGIVDGERSDVLLVAYKNWGIVDG